MGKNTKKTENEDGHPEKAKDEEDEQTNNQKKENSKTKENPKLGRQQLHPCVPFRRFLRN